MSFLYAEWRKLAMANYAIDPKLLEPYLPYKTELDLWKGKCYVSLVGFMFVNTRLLGIKVPFHINFEEVNLRFYVRYHDGSNWKRGVVFIKEIVPKPALTFVANTVYKENYETLPMKHRWDVLPKALEVSYSWKKGGRWHNFLVSADAKAAEIPAQSEIEFITEHYWGYAKASENKSNEYEVTHPRWKHYPIKNFEVDVDFGLTYGQDWSFLNDQKPDSVLLAEGSDITVESKRVIS